MKQLRWSAHAVDDLAVREIDRQTVAETVTQPDKIAEGRPPRLIYMRRYFDSTLHQRMLMRVVVEPTEQELVIVTAYKTSKIQKYLGGGE